MYACNSRAQVAESVKSEVFDLGLYGEWPATPSAYKIRAQLNKTKRNRKRKKR